MKKLNLSEAEYAEALVLCEEIRASLMEQSRTLQQIMASADRVLERLDSQWTA